jgi:hypothetical protein
MRSGSKVFALRPESGARCVPAIRNNSERLPKRPVCYILKVRLSAFADEIFEAGTDFRCWPEADLSHRCP